MVLLRSSLFSVFVVCVIGGFLGTSPVEATSLREAVSTAVQTNPRIDAAQANRRATEHVLEQARGRLYPEIDLSADYGKQIVDRPNGLGPTVNNQWRNRRQVTLGIRQALFDGWDRANDIYRAQARISAASYKILARAEAVGLNAVEAYIDVIRHRALLGLARQQVSRHEALLTIIRERIEGGRAPIGDLEQTLERLEAAKALVAQIDVASETAKAKFKSAVGRSPGRLKAAKYAPGIPKSPAAILSLALQNNPRVTAAQADIDVADLDREQFRSSFYPQLFLEGSATRGENLDGTPGRNDELKAMLVLRWKLYDGGQRRGRESELAERTAEKLAEKHILIRDLTEEIDTAWARLTRGRAQLTAIRNQVAQNEKVVASYRNEYDADKRSLLDVLDAENTRFASEFELHNVRSLHKFASYQILAQMGLLLDRLGVTTPDGGDAPVDISSQGTGSLLGTKFIIPPLK